jgi:hypothetical protein
MQRFLHECISDPVLGVVVAIALILALAMAWFVLMDGLQKRQKRQQRKRARRDSKQKAAEANSSADTPP